MKRIKLSLAAFMIAATLALGVSATSQSAAAAPATGSCANPSPTFLTFPAWYRGLVDTSDPNCGLVPPDGASGHPTLANYIWIIVLNGIDIALQLAAYVTVFMIIWGGFQFINNGGEASAVVAARKTIINAAIGLAASSAAIAAVNLAFTLIDNFKP